MSPKSLAISAACAVLTASAAFFFSQPTPSAAAAISDKSPAYTSTGEMLPPANYREWTYLSTGIDMSYLPTNGMGHTMFDNVFVNPQSYRSFVSTGTWPDKTVLVLEARGAQTKGSINKSGHFQDTDVMGIEVHVKDQSRFPGKWAFFDFANINSNGKLIPQTESCYSCHAAHAAVDTTFVQFYPTLLPIALSKGTLGTSYQKENAPTEGKQ